MNSIFIVTENLTTKGCITKATNNETFILKAFRTKRQAFEFIEQLYYGNINLLDKRDGSNISNVYIGTNVVRIRGSYRFNNGFTDQFLYVYKIEKIPFE